MSRHSGARGRWLSRGALVAVVVVLAVTGTLVALRTPDDAGAREVTALVGPAPERSFVWLKRGPGPFTDAEIRRMVSDHSYVIMDRTHAMASIRRQLDEVRRIKRADPAVRVLVYVNASYWFDTNDGPDGWDTTYDRSWSLTDPATGGPLRFNGVTDHGIADFVDLGDPAYRTFLIGLIRSWAEHAPLDGIAFDSVRPAVARFGVSDHPGLSWADVLPPDRIARYNAGLDALLRDTRRALGPRRDVLFNGIAEAPVTQNRNAAYLDDADMAMNENFCLDPSGAVNVGSLRQDLRLMADLARRGIRVLEKTNTGRTPEGAELARVGRLCTGAFLLGWQPGSSFHKLGPDYTPGELTSDPETARLRLGRPTGDLRDDGGVTRRPFENGTVIVNLTAREQRAVAGVDGTAFAGDGPGRVSAGDTLTVPPLDAVAVVRPAAPS